MNQKNYEYLRDQVKFTGFGEALEDKLKMSIEKQMPEFKLDHSTKYGNDTVAAELNFSKSKQSDMYFFNSYKVTLQREGNPEKMEQSFYIGKDNNITLKEAYNLMSGRAVNKDLTSKEGQVYNAWIQMDYKQSSENGNFKLKHYHQNYGYDLEKAIARHPIRELNNEEFKSNLIESLKKGNLQSVTFQKDGVDQKYYLEASPRFKTVNVYDGDLQRVNNRQTKSEKQSLGEGQAVKEGIKKENKASAEDDSPGIREASSKKRTKQAQAI